MLGSGTLLARENGSDLGNKLCGDANMVIDQVGHVLLTAGFVTLSVLAAMGLGLGLAFLLAEIIR